MLPDRFESLEQLARGGMGEVIAAFDRERRARVALKLARNDDDAARFMRRAASLRHEAEVLARLRHPNIIIAHDYLVLPEGDVLVLEYFPGAPHGARPPRRTLSIAARVCDALEYMHQHGLLHLDVKADNILVSGRDDVRLIDFGTAQPPGRQAERIGSPRAMSPEQLDGGEVDERSDLFALGAFLYEALAGQPRGSDYVPLGDLQWHLPIDVTMLVDQLLCFDPGARPRSAREVRDRLCAVHAP